MRKRLGTICKSVMASESKTIRLTVQLIRASASNPRSARNLSSWRHGEESFVGSRGTEKSHFAKILWCEVDSASTQTFCNDHSGHSPPVIQMIAATDEKYPSKIPRYYTLAKIMSNEGKNFMEVREILMASILAAFKVVTLSQAFSMSTTGEDIHRMLHRALLSLSLNLLEDNEAQESLFYDIGNTDK